MYNTDKLETFFMNISIFVLFISISLINSIFWQINYEIALIFCNITHISPDLSLTIFSIGYANNISVILQLIEVFILYKIVIFIEKHS